MTTSQLYPFVAGICLFIAALVYCLIRDYKKILDGGINHKNLSHWIIKALACTPCIVTLAWVSGGRWMWALAFTSAMVACVFWLSFDICLNLLRGEKWYYNGSPDKFDSITEKGLKPFPIWLQQGIKIICVAATIYIYTKLI